MSRPAARWCGASSASFCCWRAWAGWSGISLRSRGPWRRSCCREPIRCSGFRPTPSQRATVKYFFVVAALWVVQMGLGAITAHYGVEGNGLLRDSARPLAALQRDAHVAPANRPFLDCDFVAGDGAVRRAGGERRGAEGSAAGRERAVRRAADRGGRLAGRRVDEHSAQAGQPVVLVRHAGLRVCGPGRDSGRFCCSSA